MSFFEDLDFSNFWNDSEYAKREYISETPNAELIISVEKELGYKLPEAYIELMKTHNGGIPFNRSFPAQPNSWAFNHIAIEGIFGIGRLKGCSLCGEFGSKFYVGRWGYPEFGVYFADCPSAGHDMILMDYRKCGSTGEPEIVHVDQELDFKVTFLAKDFEEFITGLKHDDYFDSTN